MFKWIYKNMFSDMFKNINISLKKNHFILNIKYNIIKFLVVIIILALLPLHNLLELKRILFNKYVILFYCILLVLLFNYRPLNSVICLGFILAFYVFIIVYTKYLENIVNKNKLKNLSLENFISNNSNTSLSNTFSSNKSNKSNNSNKLDEDDDYLGLDINTNFNTNKSLDYINDDEDENEILDEGDEELYEEDEVLDEEDEVLDEEDEVLDEEEFEDLNNNNKKDFLIDHDTISINAIFSVKDGFFTKRLNDMRQINERIYKEELKKQEKKEEKFKNIRKKRQTNIST